MFPASVFIGDNIVVQVIVVTFSHFQQYKQDARIAQDSLEGFTNLENEYEKLHKTVSQTAANLVCL